MRCPATFALSRRTRYRILLAIGFPLVFAVTLWSMALKPGTPPQTGEGDLGLFRAVVNGVRAGRPYYHVYGAESRTRGYPTRSVFNWRQPLLMRTLAVLPNLSVVAANRGSPTMVPNLGNNGSPVPRARLRIRT